MSYLNDYIGKNVMIVGKVMQLRGDTATLDSEGQVQIQLNRVSAFLIFNVGPVGRS